MSKPLRFKPVNPAHEMAYSADGGWVSWEDYQSLKDTLQCSFNSNRELKAEVDELKSQPDPLTAYLYAAELAKDDIKRLKAEVERLTKANKWLLGQGNHMCDSLEESGKDECLTQSWREITAKEGKPRA